MILYSCVTRSFTDYLYIRVNPRDTWKPFKKKIL